MCRKQKTLRLTAVFFLICALFISGCGNKSASSSNKSAQPDHEPVTTGAVVNAETQTSAPEETSDPIRAMYLTDPSGNIYFVDLNYGTFFTAPVPDELYDHSGEKISADTLSAGYVLDIYGNGMMLESYPGQYPGVTKMTVVKEGTAEDASAYQDLIDSVYVEPDYSEPPYMNAEYTTDQAITCVMLTMGSHEWNYPDENGQTQNLIACGSHILEWPDLIDLTVENDTEVTLLSSMKPQSVTVTRWPVSLRAADNSSNGSEDQGEAVTVSEAGEDFLISVEPGYVYLIEASWEEGAVEYGFYTK